MNNKVYIIIQLTTFLLGIIFFCYQKEFIIFCFPNFHTPTNTNCNNKPTKKTIKLFYWVNSKWNMENIEIIWLNDDSENLTAIISNWLNLLDEEKIIEKKVSLQNILISNNNQELYISFDQNILNEENSTFNKLLIIESLLKTLKSNDIKYNKVYFLIHNQEMKDNHLDFSHAWPISGFLSSI